MSTVIVRTRAVRTNTLNEVLFEDVGVNETPTGVEAEDGFLFLYTTEVVTDGP